MDLIGLRALSLCRSEGLVLLILGGREVATGDVPVLSRETERQFYNQGLVSWVRKTQFKRKEKERHSLKEKKKKDTVLQTRSYLLGR